MLQLDIDYHIYNSMLIMYDSIQMSEIGME